MKKLLILLLTMVVALSVFADDFDSFDDFGSFDSQFDNADSGVKISGKAITDFRYYLNNEDNPVKVLPAAKISFNHETDRSGVTATFFFNQDRWENSKIDLIDELSIKGYFGNFQLEVGKLRAVWGKGDKLHVIDNFNSDDLVNFVIPDYIDRRIAIPMIRASYSVPSNSNVTIEGIYTPFIAKDRFNTSGELVPFTAKRLQTVIESGLQGLVGATAGTPYATAVLARASEINSNNNLIYPNLYRLKYSQFGARITGTLSSFDWGVSYYNGYYKQPSFNAEKFGAWLTPATVTAKPDFLEFDRKQTFGVEGATTVWRFNVRGELAYNLTEDSNGDNPWVHNDSLQWLGGFDIDLPLWNMNLNVQETGTFVLGGDKCDDNTKMLAAIGASDVDWNDNGYWDNMIVANLSASFLHDKLKPEVSVMWDFNRSDVVLMPKITYDITPELSFNLLMSYTHSKNENSKFFGFNTSDFIQLGASYTF